MTRINTNVSSLTAQKSLAQSNAQLQVALSRLSTGLRINSGKDDPAGLIASEALRADITSTQKAISNTQRAGQMLATADSALGQVNSLLNDIRGLVTEAANTGAMSEAQIAANQLQVDASLDALNRIAQVTSFQGRRLLDGGLDFVTSPVAGMDSVRDMQVDSAALPANGTMGVGVAITQAATQAEITDSGFSDADNAEATVNLAAGATVAGAAASIDIMANSLDSKYDNVDIEIALSDDVEEGEVLASYSESSSKLTITLNTDEAGVTAKTVVDAINGTVPQFHAYVAEADEGDEFTKDDAGAIGKTGTASMTITAENKGATYNNLAILFKTASGIGGDAPTAEYSADENTLTITVDDAEATELATIQGEIEDIEVDGAQAFTVTLPDDAGSTIERTSVYGGGGADTTATGNTLATGGDALKDDLVVQISGLNGSQVFSFNKDTDVIQIARQINMRTDVTGVSATASIDEVSFAGSVSFKAEDYGSAAFAAVSVISEGDDGTFRTNLSDTRQTGTDIEASVNGAAATGKGNTLSINTSGLSMTVTVADGSETAFSFNLSGGALFQVGPDVVSAQQARMGIQSVNTATLGGVSGRLYLLGTGQSAALATDAVTAGKIVDEVIDKVTALRGRLGAFQKSTLDTNIKSLSDTVENLTAAESSIRDADFATESANLTRAQILVQAGTSVLAVANRNPENVLALLR